MSYKVNIHMKFNGAIDLSLIKHLTYLNFPNSMVRDKIITPTYKVSHKFITQIIINKFKGNANKSKNFVAKPLKGLLVRQVRKILFRKDTRCTSPLMANKKFKNKFKFHVHFPKLLMLDYHLSRLLIFMLQAKLQPCRLAASPLRS